MKYPFTVQKLDVSTGGKKVVLLSKEDAADLALTSGDRVHVWKNNKSCTAIVDLTSKFIKQGNVGLFSEVVDVLKAKNGEKVYIEHAEKPVSVDYIRKKMDGHSLTKEEINTIISDLMAENLSEVELAGLISAWYIHGLNDEETIALIKSIVASGNTLNFNKRPILDKHCLGGVPGNRTTMLIVPIIASAGLLIPKTSSRSITSPAGTADTMEVLAKVDLNEQELKKVVEATNGCIAWGGAINLAAADDKLIKIRHPLSLDPEGVMLASILAKKKAVGATNVLIDIPMGYGAKIETKRQAEAIAEKIMRYGSLLGMEIKCIITPGYDPIGQAVGPALEAREVLRILEGENVSPDLKEKSIVMAGILLESGGKVKNGEGAALARKILESGEALEKFREIIKYQKGDPRVTSKDVEVGKYTETLKSDRDGRIHYIDIKKIAKIARAAGAPKNKKAGLYFYVEKGDKVKKGQELLTVYAETEEKLQSALDLYQKLQPIEFEKIILGEFTTEQKPKIYTL